MQAEALALRIKTEALRLGFSACGIARAEPIISQEAHLQQWLQLGYHANMQYMENHFDKRVNPTLLVDGAKSVISLLTNYYPAQLQPANIPQVAKYAYGRDYHKTIKKSLLQLLQFIQLQTNANGRCFVDSAPVLEKYWAQQAGLGWIGKNGCLINKKMGSFFFISEIIIDIDFPTDKPETDHCGSCAKCMSACPTNAIAAPKVVDARKCISYQTIENKAPFAPENAIDLHNRIFGCDICQDICPWNRFAKATQIADFTPRAALFTLDQAKWLGLTETDFNLHFAGTPLMRAGYVGLKRNAGEMGVEFD